MTSLLTSVMLTAISVATILKVVTAIEAAPQTTVARNTTRLGRTAFGIIKADQYDYNDRCNTKDHCGTNVQDSDCIYLINTFDGYGTGYFALDFTGGAAAVKIIVASSVPITVGPGRLEITLDSRYNDPIVTLFCGYTGGAEAWAAIDVFLEVPILEGVHDVYLNFYRPDCDGSDDCPPVANIDWFMFSMEGVSAIEH